MSNWHFFHDVTGERVTGHIPPSVREQHVVTNCHFVIDGRSNEITLDKKTLDYLSAMPNFTAVEKFIQDSLFLAIQLEEHTK